MSLQDVSDATGLSTSFLSAVERGNSDIALSRLAKLAAVFGHDVGSLLGSSVRKSQPAFTRDSDRIAVDRGKGIEYEVIRVPGTPFELVQVTFSPFASFSEALAHEGVDIALVQDGELILVYDTVEYTLRAGDCVTWPAGYLHKLRNDKAEPARLLFIVTEALY